MKGRAIAAALLVALAACGADAPDAPRDSGVKVVPLEEGGPTDPAVGPAASDAVSTPAPAGGDDEEPDAPSTPRPAPRDNVPVGTNAYFFLNRVVPGLVVEIDAVTGLSPPSSVRDLVRSRLEEVTDKPAGITLTAAETVPGQGADGVWTRDELIAAEKRNRDNSSSADRMAIYLQFLDGTYEDSDAVGVAYGASSAAIFSQHIEEIATVLVGAEAIERAATIHEIGHLLSLVNIGYRSPRPREDPDHPNHSSNPDSVMYWAVDNVGVVTVLGGDTGLPTDFDADDRADLEDVRTAKLR